MPWEIKKDDRCPADKPWGVVKADDDSLEGCHESEDAAKKQQAALYASETRSESDEEFAPERPLRENLVRFVAGDAIRAVEDSESKGDGRLATLVGNLVTFNQWAEVKSPVEGHFMERSAPGAYTKTFAENRSRMQVIFDHGMDKAIGRKPLGPLETVHDDGRTIHYEAALLDTSYNRDLLPGLRAGLYGSSWRMDNIKPDFTDRPKRSEYNPLGLPEVTIREARVIELGPTPFPVYHGTTAGIRSMTDEYLIARMADDPERLAALITQARVALQPVPEASPQSDGGSRSTAVYPPISLDDFVEKLSGHS